MQKKSLYLLTLSSLVAPNMVLAQGIVNHEASLAGHFFVSVIAGVIIAVGIQFLLSNLAIASGITAIGDITDYEGSNGGSSSDSSSGSDSTKETGRKLSAGLGIFMTVTMSISLFAATWLAVDLSLSNTILNGAIVGIVIWALFFLTAVVVDVKLTTAICGNLIGLVQRGLQGAGDTVANIFSASDADKARTLAKETVGAIREEIQKEFDTSDVDSKIKQYIDRATADSFSARDFRKELETLINEIEIEERYVTDDPEAARKLVLDIASQRPSLDEQQKQKISQALDDLKAAAKEGDTHQQRATAAFDKLSPGDEAQGQAYRQQISDYLDKTGREELSSEQIEQDINRIFDNPSAAQRIIKDRANQLDRESIKALLAAHKNMDEQKADKILSVYDKVLAKLEKAKQQETPSTTTSNLPARRSQAETRVQRWFDRMNRPELRYRDLKADFMAILNDPTCAPDVLSRRLNRMDENTVRALLTNNDQIDQSDIDHYLNQYNEAKTELNDRITEMRAETERRLKDIKHRAFVEAEAIRATAASAAWWLFFSALVSAASAALAGAIASGLL